MNSWSSLRKIFQRESTPPVVWSPWKAFELQLVVLTTASSLSTVTAEGLMWLENLEIGLSRTSFSACRLPTFTFPPIQPKITRSRLHVPRVDNWSPTSYRSHSKSNSTMLSAILSVTKYDDIHQWSIFVDWQTTLTFNDSLLLTVAHRLLITRQLQLQST